ncbi:hypothetical protein SAMN02745136_03882 [Anaerocolumna jejuensis DSM 15929]|uniref:DUF4367 domain-containing protein n=1 Tax=Anaerocolumna jejuensis DSM 15929 TaxID=1121322 RepID=A0A1M6X4M5_9FIRM|nr:hypothetical protein [Anaerocolumna jejuensis]SHL00873.1 hypothetical protein SAMN02745136_03882 [Anaerocolumna jejuensis DSM 15929]
MKKLIVIALSAVMALSFAACTNNPPKQISGQAAEGDSQQIPNPFKDCKTVAEAEKTAGFTLALPEKIPEGYVQKSIQAIKNDMIQVIYENGKKELLIRKAKGKEDISGDYNKYSENNTMTVGSLQVSTRGNDGKIKVAAWTDGEYTFAVSVNSEDEGLDNTAISDMISSMKAEGDTKEKVQIPNPFEDCKTIAEAKKIAGFTLALPEKMPKGYAQNSIQAIKDDLVQVFYENGEKELLIRKGKGSEDISGDYNKYSENNTMTVGSLQVSTRGNDGKVQVAAWVNGEYAYSISAGYDAAGLDTTVISDLVKGIR